MTLNEAIDFAISCAEIQEGLAIREGDARVRECNKSLASQYRQIAKWLKELKTYRGENHEGRMVKVKWQQEYADIAASRG